MISENELNRKAVKRILIVLISGTIFLLLDISSGFGINPVYTSPDGNIVYMVRPDENKASNDVRISAEIKTSEKTFRRDYDVVISPYSSDANNAEDKASDQNKRRNSGEASSEELFTYEIKRVINNLNDDTSQRFVALPSKLSSGEKIHWTVKRKTHASLIIFMTMMFMILIYKSRMKPLKKLHEAQQSSVVRQLPEFVNSLVLLLNAGMVLNSAFEKTIETCCRQLDTENHEKDFFYVNMRNIYAKLKHTNGSLGKEFQSFAYSGKSIGGDAANDLIRISNILNDNISKGVELTEKLRSESEILWLNRKRNCEERGRLAETKLTLPLTLFLLVLIVITVSPALLEL